MESLPLVYVPDIRLAQVSQSVAEVNREVKAALENMLHTVHHEGALALAGVQVGIMQRLVVIDIDGAYRDRGKDGMMHGGKPLFMVNPEIIEASNEKTAIEEGCMSIPGVSVEVPRPRAVKVRYLNENGKECMLETKDNLLTACVQHEIDHTNGILIIDILSPLKRDMQVKKSIKFLKNKK